MHFYLPRTRQRNARGNIIGAGELDTTSKNSLRGITLRHLRELLSHSSCSPDTGEMLSNSVAKIFTSCYKVIKVKAKDCLE